jgi:hypothetical protein
MDIYLPGDIGFREKRDPVYTGPAEKFSVFGTWPLALTGRVRKNIIPYPTLKWF